MGIQTEHLGSVTASVTQLSATCVLWCVKLLSNTVDVRRGGRERERYMDWERKTRVEELNIDIIEIGNGSNFFFLER